MSADPLRLLIVCTANRCRSPMASVIAAEVASRGGRSLRVSSAGTHATDCAPATGATIRAVQRLGLDLSSHRSRPVTPGMVAGADLVLAMEREHVMDMVILHGARLASTFTVPELAARLRDVAAFLPIREALDVISTHRTPADVLLAPEIDDPTGTTDRRHRRTASALADALSPIIDRATP